MIQPPLLLYSMMSAISISLCQRHKTRKGDDQDPGKTTRHGLGQGDDHACATGQGDDHAPLGRTAVSVLVPLMSNLEVSLLG